MKNNNGVGWIGTSTRTVMVRTQCKPLKQAGLGHRHKLRIASPRDALHAPTFTLTKSPKPASDRTASLSKINVVSYYITRINGVCLPFILIDY